MPPPILPRQFSTTVEIVHSDLWASEVVSETYDTGTKRLGFDFWQGNYKRRRMISYDENNKIAYSSRPVHSPSMQPSFHPSVRPSIHANAQV
jgi:hypothetical protein